MTVTAINSRNGTRLLAVAGLCCRLKNTQKQNQVLIPGIIFLAVPWANRYDWETRFSALSCPRNTENTAVLVYLTTGLRV